MIPSKETVVSAIANLLAAEDVFDEAWLTVVADAYLDKKDFEQLVHPELGEIPEVFLEGFPFSIDEQLDLIFKPAMDRSNREWEASELIPVKMGEKTFNSYLDSSGVQRFVPNTIILNLLNEGKLDLNQLVADFQKDKFSTDEYLEIMTSIDYSVAGFCDLWAFQHLSVENPLWEE